MKDIIIYKHFYKNYPFNYSDLYLPVTNESNVNSPQCRFIPKYLRNTKFSDHVLGEFDTFIYLSQIEKEADYVGVSQYRRYPDFLSKCPQHTVIREPTEENLKYLTSDNQKTRALDMLGSHDVIIYRPFQYLGLSYIAQWSHNGTHPPEAFDIFMDELYKTEYRNNVNYFYSQQDILYVSPLITKWENFIEFSKFYIYIIQKLLAREDFTILFNKASQNQRFHNKRLLAFIGERLIPFWCFSKKLNTAHIQLAVTENVW